MTPPQNPQSAIGNRQSSDPRVGRAEQQESTSPTPAPDSDAAAVPASQPAPSPLCPPRCDVSVIVPLKDEQDNVEPLYAELHDVLRGADLDYEIIFVDDGSGDDSLERLRSAVGDDPLCQSRVTIISLRRNFGQTAALAAGIDHSRGDVIVPIDADLQNDPHDIPALLAKLDEQPGYDIVSGWRKDRKDRWLDRRLPSQVANWIIRRITHVPIHDFGCTLKAYRREVLDGVSLYSEMHRLLPALAAWNGARIAEMVVNHRPRLRGVTKYGLTRMARVLLDLVTVVFFGSYMTKPIYFFGKIAAVSGVLSFVSLGVAVAQKYGYLGQPEGLHLNRNVLVTLAALLAFFAVQCILFGVISELLVRVYHDTRNRPTYRIRRIFQVCHPITGSLPPSTARGIPRS